MARFPLPNDDSARGQKNWRQTLHQKLESTVDDLYNKIKAKTQASTSSTVVVGASTAAASAFVPMQFAGTPLTFVTDAVGNLILVGFSPP